MNVDSVVRIWVSRIAQIRNLCSAVLTADLQWWVSVSIKEVLDASILK
jgi:hypothetical protein